MNKNPTPYRMLAPYIDQIIEDAKGPSPSTLARVSQAIRLINAYANDQPEDDIDPRISLALGYLTAEYTTAKLERSQKL